MKDGIIEIVANFVVAGKLVSVETFHSGHINDTFIITYTNGKTGNTSYTLQRINHNVFKNPPSVIENIKKVTEHLQKKLKGHSAVSRRSLALVPAKDGKLFYRDHNNNYWRLYFFIENTRTYDLLENEEQGYQVAKAFGEFQKLLSDLPGEELHETIPDFHNTPKRYSHLEKAIEEDCCGRSESAREEIEFALKRKDIAEMLPLIEKKLPKRVTHNDTKVNNVLIDDNSGEGICIIDLDTVMPGLSLFDFGDLVRTATSPAAEDERDLTKVTMRMSMFEALADGYLSEAGAFLTPEERGSLVYGSKLITLEIGVRFLTDYLNGDTYFKTRRDGHNLDRCRAQFKLVESIEAQEEEMNRYIENILCKNA